MADEHRRDTQTEPTPERQGVREPQPIEGTSAAGRASGSELDSRREFEAADVARQNEPRTTGEPATGAREPQEPRGAHVRGRGEDAGENSGVVGRVRNAWDRLRHRV